ncbi:MAG: VPLPA-CTERM sorting domain-containing protein [Phycisphaerales bacterium]
MTKALLSGLAVAVVTAAASASTVSIEFGSSSRHDPLPGAPGTVERNRGGEFFVTGALGSFSSFCLEFNEGIGESSYNFSIDRGAIAGGVGGGNPDLIGRETAELYRQFVAGSLGPTGGQSLTAFNDAFQDAIWFLEEELGGVDFDAATAMASSVNFVNLSASAQSLINSVWGTTAGVGRVRALNLYDISTGANRQSILYITAIPLPSAGALALAGLFGVAAVRRRRVL